MRFLLDNRRHLLAALHDTLMAGISLVLALYLRLGDDVLFYTGTLLPTYAFLCMSICLAVFIRMRLYRGLWRYASTPDLVAITQSATLGLFLFYLVVFSLNRLEGVPRSVPFIQWLLLLALLGGPRFLYRILRDRQLGMQTSLTGESRIPVLLVGAGDRAELFLRDTRSGPSAQYVVVGFLDDNPSRLGHTIHGVRIYGRTDELAGVVEKLAGRGIRPQRVILTYDTLEGARVRALLDASERLGIPLARLPRLSEFKAGVEEKYGIRPIAVEDLLGRAQNVHDTSPVRDFVQGKVVVVTGAGGTIGSELARQIASFSPACLILFELSEYALYQIDQELMKQFPQIERLAVLGDVRDARHLDALFARHQPQVVFHAAAIKHVPLAEINPEEAALTNIYGTRCLADACAKAGVLVMVLISTDKAVNPTSFMGATKRAAESYCQALSTEGSKTRFVSVRFGNVLGSTGSVVPLFQSQLAAGGPLTVTHRDMVRYFMTVREAVELVLQSATLPEGGKGAVFVLDMGQPVRILDLAEQMIRLAGLKPYEDIPIVFSGLRKGEKMFEELFHFSESFAKTAHESIWLASLRHPPMEEMMPALESLFAACIARDPEKAAQLMRILVPEYRPQ